VSKPLILVDFDGVIGDFVSLYLHLHSYLNGRDCTPEQITEFDFTKCIASQSEDGLIWAHLDTTQGLVEGLPVIDGALEGLDRLRQIGRVVCVTSPHTGTYWSGERFRQLKRLGFDKRDVVLAADKTLVPGDMLIDDRFETVMAWSRAHPRGVGVIFDQPWNRSRVIERRTRCYRAKGWPKVVAFAGLLPASDIILPADVP
jgi:5'(3')-deoxyribonucleotidase